MFSKPAEVKRRAKLSLGSVFICGPSDREARKLSEARGREATNVERLPQCCCVLVFRIRTLLSGRKKKRRKLREEVTKSKEKKKKRNTFAGDRVTIDTDRTLSRASALALPRDQPYKTSRFFPLRRLPASSDSPSTFWSSRSL